MNRNIVEIVWLMFFFYLVIVLFIVYSYEIFEYREYGGNWV